MSLAEPSLTGRPAPKARGVALALASAAGFSTLGVFTKMAYASGLSPTQALAWRFAGAAAVLWVPLAFRGGWRRPPRDYLTAAALGLLGFAPQAGLYFLTLRYLSASLTSLLLYLYPACVVGLSFVFLGRRPTRAQLAAVILSGLGCVLTLWSRGDYPLVGYALGVSVAVAYAAYLVIAERAIRRLDPLFASTIIMSVAAAAYWAFLAATGTVRAPSGPEALAGIAGMALLGSVLPIVTLFAAIRLIGSADASLVSTIEPLFTVAIAAAALGERLTPEQVAGGVLIMAGVAIVNASAARKGTATAACEGKEPSPCE